jgi:hypothetical protein
MLIWLMILVFGGPKQYGTSILARASLVTSQCGRETERKTAVCGRNQACCHKTKPVWGTSISHFCGQYPHDPPSSRPHPAHSTTSAPVHWGPSFQLMDPWGLPSNHHQTIALQLYCNFVLKIHLLIILLYFFAYMSMLKTDLENYTCRW